MPAIPMDMLPVLTDLGIGEPEESAWKHLDPWPGKYLRAHYFCTCGNRPNDLQKVELEHTWLGDKRVFIGQCRWCKTVYWRDALPSH